MYLYELVIPSLLLFLNLRVSFVFSLYKLTKSSWDLKEHLSSALNFCTDPTTESITNSSSFNGTISETRLFSSSVSLILINLLRYFESIIVKSYMLQPDQSAIKADCNTHRYRDFSIRKQDGRHFLLRPDPK